MSDSLRRPNPVDVHVGGRIRTRRRVMRISQEGLAEVLGLTFQQVQKYERGANRVSSSKLFAIAAALQVPVGYFFEGLPDTGRQDLDAGDFGSGETVHAFLSTTEGLELARRFPRIPTKALRKQILELVRALSEDGALAPETAVAERSESS